MPEALRVRKNPLRRRRFYLRSDRSENKLKIIPLGGLGEIGKNMTIIRYGDEMIMIDAGLMFPENDMLGIDLVIPDISYVLENRNCLRAIILTHGHEDHIGALPYILKKLSVPVYGTRLTLGILTGRLKEDGVECKNLRSVSSGEIVMIGCFSVGFIRVNHSIPDSVGLSIKTPVGMIVHTGDFKLDYTPIDGKMTDFRRFADLGQRGVLLLMADSTNSEKEGHTPSEKTVGTAFNRVFQNAPGRIVVATFSSNVHRIQQAIDTAIRYRRRVAILGRSMVNVVNISLELGYIHAPEGTIIDIEEIRNYPANKIVIITTGSQGEPMSALTRMAMSDHRQVDIIPGDTVIISATPIPGNEKLVAKTVDNLLRLGANVVHRREEGIHVSGHAARDELRLIHNLIKPKFFMPVHGELHHLFAHAKLAEELGMNRENILVGENGSVFEFTRDSAKLTGKINAGVIMVDGLGVGDVGNIVLRDRRQLSQDGIMIVVVPLNRMSGRIASNPDIVSRGFVYVRESERLMDDARARVLQTLRRCKEDQISDWMTIKTSIRDSLAQFLFEQTRRRPMILPIIVEV
ncbi:MAG: ribonuclease J [Selenomonadaceae bacterium]|nr:ribonuclease J [Selenomonadaceae bacterium]